MIQIDPKTGERIDGDIDPSTGERRQPAVAGLPANQSLPQLPDRAPASMQSSPLGQDYVPHNPENTGIFGIGSRIQDKFDNATREVLNDGTIGAHLQNVGSHLGQVIAPVIHPYKSAKAAVQVGLDGPQIAAGKYAANIYQDAQNNGNVAAAEHVAGDVGAAVLGEGLTKTPLRDSVTAAEFQPYQAAKDRLFPASKNVTDPEIGARKLTSALTVQPQAQPSFVPAATQEGGTVVDFAKRNNLPLNGTLDFKKAAQGAADEIQGFYNDKVVEPNGDIPIPVSDINFGGKTFGENRMSNVREVNGRIDEINRELNSNYRKALPGQTAQANAADADLIAEKRALTDRLHKTLADATGTTPEQISDLRTRAGKLRTIADEAGLADANRLAAQGANQVGTHGIGVGGVKHSVINQVWQGLQGGPEVMGNRAVKGALKYIPANRTELPSIAPPRPFDPSSANLEAAHAVQLEQAAQDAAAGRSQRVQGYKTSRDALKDQQNKLQGDYMRDVGAYRSGRKSK